MGKDVNPERDGGKRVQCMAHPCILRTKERAGFQNNFAYTERILVLQVSMIK